MSTRTFTVFKDASPKKTAKPRPLGRASSSAAILSSSRLSENSVNPLTILSTSAEKENAHPLTGSSSHASLGKKRKTSESGGVLATKVLAMAASDPAISKQQKPKRADLKRKALSDVGPEKTKLKRESSKISASRDLRGSVSSAPAPQPRTSHKRTRSSSVLQLETIKEETSTSTDAAKDTESESVKQAIINSKCKDLTVSPLADVSGAYIQSSERKADEVHEEKLCKKDVSACGYNDYLVAP